MRTKIITNAQTHRGRIQISGARINENNQREMAEYGLLINTVNPWDVVEFDELEIVNVKVPIIHRRGILKIGKLTCANFSHDLLNSGGNLTIDQLNVEYHGDRWKFNRAGYHSDALGQFFNDKSGICANVEINNIYARITGKSSQGMMLSSGKTDYINFNIGMVSADIEIDYRYAFVANSLKYSLLNMGDNNSVKIRNVKKGIFNTTSVYVHNAREYIT